MILSGAGLYTAPTPCNAMLFDRLIAVSGRIGTAAFLIYLVDACGDAGSCALLLWRNVGMVRFDWLGFDEISAYVTCVVGIGIVLLAAL